MNTERAIEALTWIKDKLIISAEYKKALDMAIEALSKERTGEWVSHELWDMPWFTCSECNYHGRSDFKFCPNCGAKMKGGTENDR